MLWRRLLTHCRTTQHLSRSSMENEKKNIRLSSSSNLSCSSLPSETTTTMRWLKWELKCWVKWNVLRFSCSTCSRPLIYASNTKLALICNVELSGERCVLCVQQQQSIQCMRAQHISALALFFAWSVDMECHSSSCRLFSSHHPSLKKVKETL